MLDRLPLDVLVHEVLIHCKKNDIFAVSTVNRNLFDTLQEKNTVKYLDRECVQYVQPHGKVINELGTIRWYREGQLHRDFDLPAIISSNGIQQWYKKGELHRDQSWYKNGKRHRDGDKPACVWSNGTQAWYKNGELHRDGDKPALIWGPSGNQEWWKNGVLV